MKALADLINSLALLSWPALVALALLKLWPAIKSMIESRDFRIKYGDVELTVQDASDQLRKQIEDLQNQVSSLLQASPYQVTSRATGHRTRKQNRLIIWVDDNPTNNAFEVVKFKNDGFDVMQVESTASALSIIEGSEDPTAIISDMSRKEGSDYVNDAGLRLIRELRARECKSPIFIYTSERYAQKHHDTSIEAGGNGATASPVALFTMVEQNTI